MTARHPSAGATVGLLVAASACSFVDRQLLSLLIEPIKADLHLSDTGVSLLLGLAFVACYALAGPPIGLLIDRTRRWRIVATGIAVWSVMTAGTALASTYAQLFLFRMGVGIGEATLNPAAYSLIPDVVRRERRGMAIALFGLGVYAGAGLALVIGGQVIGLLARHGPIALPLIGTLRPWQAAFLVVGALGVPVAAIAWSMREPVRLDAGEAPSLRDVLRHLRDHAGVVAGIVGLWAGVLMAGYSAGAWLPAFMGRTHGWTAMRVGLWFGLIVVVAGASGAITGGWLSDRAAARRPGGRLIAVAMLALVALPCALAFPLVATPVGALALVAAFTFGQAGAAAAAPSVLQDVLPGRMRGFASALVLAAVTLLALGLGPTLIALMTDRAFANPAALRWSLAIAVPTMLGLATLAGLAALPAYRKLLHEVNG